MVDILKNPTKKKKKTPKNPIYLEINNAVFHIKTVESRDSDYVM